MNTFYASLKVSFYFCVIELFAFVLLYLALEILFSGKGIALAYKVPIATGFMRLAYLQIILQFAAVAFLFRFNINLISVYFICLVLFVGYYSFLRREFIGFSELFGYIYSAKGSPSFLCLMLSVGLSLVIVSKYFLNK